MRKKQLRGGNSSIMKNGVLYGASSSNCLRMILLRDKGIQSEPDERSKKVFAIGHLNEDLFEKDHLQDVEGLEKEKEYVIGVHDNVDFCGHIDFASPGHLFELKSCTSENTYKKVFTNKKYKIENLIQLATYMLMSETPQGFLCYTSYTDKIQYKALDKLEMDDILQLAEESERETVMIPVTFNEEGEVLANGKGSGVFVADILEFQEAAINVLDNDLIHADRPESFELNTKFTACYSCPLSNLCNEWEEKRFSTDEFVSKASSIFNKERK